MRNPSSRCASSMMTVVRMMMMIMTMIMTMLAVLLATCLPVASSAWVPDDMHTYADNHRFQRKVEATQDGGVGGGRGLLAMQDVKPKEVLLTIPLSKMLQLRSTDETETDRNWQGMMAVKLCQELRQGAASPHAEYLKSLPTEAPLVLHRWTQDQVAQLHNATVHQIAHDSAVWASNQYDRHARDLGIPQHTFYEMLDMAGSRTFRRSSNGLRLMVPFVDFANYAPARDNGGTILIGQRVVEMMAGPHGAKQGEEIFVDYGSLTSDEFLQYYGFVPHDVLHDTIAVDVHGPSGVSTATATSTATNTAAVVVGWKDCEAGVGHCDPGIRKACRDMLDALPTSLQQDLAELDSLSTDEYTTQHMALGYRIAKKRLLNAAIGSNNQSDASLSSSV